MTFSELKTQFINLADDPQISDVQAGVWINMAYRLLVREHDWPFVVGNGSYTVTSGTQETLFSAFTTAITDFAKPLRVWIANSSGSDKTPLQPIRYEERNIPGITNSYYITPGNLGIGLVPTPTNSTDVITVDYLKSTTDLSASGDEPMFLSDFHSILVWKPLVLYAKQQREASDEFELPYQEVLSSMLSFYSMPQAGTATRMSRGVNIKRGWPSDSPLSPVA
jgi:hypothetical protein